MKKYLKLVSAALAIIGTIMMFFTQVTITWNHAPYHKESLSLAALVGGKSQYAESFNGTSAGLAGYILLGVAAVILLIVSLFPYFKEHDILSAVVTGIGVIAIIIGVFFLFFLRKNFMNTNGLNSKDVLVGWGAIAGGSLGSLAAAAGTLSVILDIAEQ